MGFALGLRGLRAFGAGLARGLAVFLVVLGRAGFFLAVLGFALR